MKGQTAAVVLASVLAAGVADRALAQGVGITPQIGVYIPASDFYDLRDGADEIRLEKEGTLGLGLAVEMGWVRASLAYATGARLNDHGVSGGDDIGDGSVLAAAADLVLRPLPRLPIQPYFLAGAGLKKASYDTDEGVSGAFEGDTEFAAHFGLGVELLLGHIGIVAEATDFLSRDPDGDWRVHDAFAMVGLKLRL